MCRASVPCQALRAASSKSKNKRNRKASPSQAQAAAAAARKPIHPIAEALDLVKSGAKAKFDETVEVIRAVAHSHSGFRGFNDACILHACCWSSKPSLVPF